MIFTLHLRQYLQQWFNLNRLDMGCGGQFIVEMLERWDQFHKGLGWQLRNDVLQDQEIVVGTELSLFCQMPLDELYFVQCSIQDLIFMLHCLQYCQEYINHLQLNMYSVSWTFILAVHPCNDIYSIASFLSLVFFRTSTFNFSCILSIVCQIFMLLGQVFILFAHGYSCNQLFTFPSFLPRKDDFFCSVLLISLQFPFDLFFFWKYCFIFSLFRLFFKQPISRSEDVREFYDFSSWILLGEFFKGSKESLYLFLKIYNKCALWMHIFFLL